MSLIRLADRQRKRRRLQAVPVKPERAGELSETLPSEFQPGRMDRALLLTVIVLSVFGLMSVYTASARQAMAESGSSLAIVGKQILAMGLGGTLMVLISRLHFNRWNQWAMPLTLTTIVLLLATMFLGVTANGSERWLALPGGFQFQPSELAKLAAVCLLAQATSQKRFLTPTLMVNVVIVLGMIYLIYQQPSLSMAILTTTVMLSMLFLGGVSLLAYALCLPPMAYVVFLKIKGTAYQWRRILGWLDPWGDPLDSGYNLIQSYYAIGSGGILGRGLGQSIQKLYYLPFQHTDFIFAVICEELGLFGSLAVLTLYTLIGWRGFVIAQNAVTPFGRMLASGITVAILVQAAINICVTTGLMPVTGVTLPLISYGGTSAIITLMMMGILLNISRYRKPTALQVA